MGKIIVTVIDNMMKVKMSLVIIVCVLFATITQAKEKCDFWVDNETAFDEITNLFNGEQYSRGKVSGNLCINFLNIPDNILNTSAIDTGNIITYFGNLSYDETGSSYYIFPLKKGKLKSSGIIKGYYQGGSLLAEIPYKEWTIDGFCKIFYEASKQERIIIPIKNDKIEGVIKIYYESGKLEAEIPYKNDKIEGVAKWYYENGRLWSILTYVNDEIKSGKCANGRQWTSAELTNWKNGLSVGCY